MEILLLTFCIFLVTTLICTTALYPLAVFLKNNSIMDVAYGPVFAIAGWATLYVTDTWHIVPLIIVGAVSIWALRLGVRIGKKNWRRPEDPRYATWRTTWAERGQFYLLLRSYLQVFLLQGIIISVVGLPMVLAIASVTASAGAPKPPIFLVFFAGLAIWAFGLLYETIADWQLDRFLSRKRAGTEPEASAPLMQTGLFRYSRRPNYFGEITCWVGLAIATATLPLGTLAVASPLLIGFIIIYVTGPILEDYFLNRFPTEYQAYKDTTSYIFPWFPKSRIR